MALKLNDRVKETSTTTGTGTLDLSGAVTAFETFVAGIGDGNTTYYAIVNRDEDEWEVGLGTVTDASTDTLARTTVISSSNSDSAVDFSAGTKDVFCTLPASKIASLDTNNNLTIGTGSAGVDYTLTFDGADADGVLTWMEDEDYFKFSDDILINSTEKIQFYDTGLYIYSSTDGQLDIVADTEVQIAATTIDINGAVALNGAITGATDITLSGELDAATLDISGNADIDGTLETDALSIASTTVTTTAAEINLIDGGTARGTTAVADGDGILINDDGTMRMTTVQTVSTYMAAESVGGGNIVTVGALDSGSITSGFGAIDNGTSGIRTNTFTAETSLVPDASGGADIGTAALEWGDIYVADDKYIQFGSDQNILIGYDETTTDTLKIAATEGAGLAITLMADEGDDAGDEWKLNVADGGTITLGNDINSAGTYVTHLTLTPNSTVTSSLATFAGEVQMVTLDIGGTNVTTTAAEINLIDGGTSRGTTAVASGDGILINDGGTMAMTNVDTVSTYFASHSVGGGNIVTTGALDSGSITSGFGAIDNGTSGIRTDTFTAETSIIPDASGGADLGSASAEWGDFYIADDKYIQFGSDQNVLVGYDETTTDSLKIAATEGAGLAITLMADEGDDAGDEWKLNVADGGTITLGNDINSAGTYVTHLTLTPNSTVTSSLATFAGEVQMVTLDIGGTNVTSTAAELNILDGVTSTATELNYSDLTTLGTSAASKVLSADSNNLTKITGGVYLEEDTLTFDTTQDWDVRASPVAQVTLTANVTFDLPSNPTTGQYISILCIQDGTGSRTIAWNAAFEFTGGTAPTATTTAAKGDLFTFRYHNSHWIEVGRNLNLTRA